jgi:hypothetical protein
MTQPQVIKLTAVIGLFLVVFLTGEHLKPAKKNAIGREIQTEAVRAANAPPQRSDTATPVQKTDLNPDEPPVQAAPNPWQEKLNALIAGREELFGPAGEARLKELQDFVAGIAATNLPVVVREMQELQMQKPTVFGRELRLHLLRQWAESDAYSAANWITQMPANDDRQEALATAANAWAGQDFAGAATWANQLPDGVESQKVLESIADEAVYEHPMEALTLAATLPASSARDNLITRATEVWAATSPEDAAAWADQIPDETLREQVTAVVAMRWAGSDPAAAGTLAIDSMSLGPGQDQAVIAIVEQWGRTDMQGATAWVNQFPEGPLRENATAILDQYAKLDGSMAQSP